MYSVGSMEFWTGAIWPVEGLSKPSTSTSLLPLLMLFVVINRWTRGEPDDLGVGSEFWTSFRWGNL